MTDVVPEHSPPSRLSTGTAGLDDVLGGGLPRDRLYLVQGLPGAGKTTLALRFLLEGVARGESALYVTLSETRAEIEQVAASHGWSLEGLHMFELSAAEQVLRLEQHESLYASADVELREAVRVLLGEVERTQPSRVVFDSLSEIRLLAQSPERYRRQILALKQFFSGRHCTVLLLDDRVAEQSDAHVESLAHGVIRLDQLSMGYGADRRRLRIAKLRGSSFRSGHHDCVIRTGGLVVFPRLVAAEHRTEFVASPISSSIPELDALLGGGLDRGTSTLVLGPAGTGKSVVATHFAACAAARGERAAIFAFEERLGTLRARSRALGMPMDEQERQGRVILQQIDPAELSPDEFSHLVREAVESRGVNVVVVDSLNGYFSSMASSNHLMLQMHEMLSFLAERGVTTILTLAQSGILGSMKSPVDISYLADTVLLLRHFEAEGRVRKAISALKKRSGWHEDTIRELVLRPSGIAVGPPLADFHGVLTGTPMFTGRAELLDDEPSRDAR